MGLLLRVSLQGFGASGAFDHMARGSGTGQPGRGQHVPKWRVAIGELTPATRACACQPRLSVVRAAAPEGEADGEG